MKRIAQLSGGYTNTRAIRRVASIFNDAFATNQQQDTCEYLQTILRSCEPMEKGFINRIFINDVCQICKAETPSTTPKHVMLLDVYQNSFDDMVTKAFENQSSIKKRCSSLSCSLLLENQGQSEGVEHIRKENFILESQVLVMQASIFFYHGGVQSYEQHKIQKEIVPMEIIHLPDRNKVLELFGIIYHEGNTLRFGHYTCDVRTSDNIWYHCNDKNVKRTNAFLKNGYMFFYCLKDKPTEKPAEKHATMKAIILEENNVEGFVINENPPLFSFSSDEMMSDDDRSIRSKNSTASMKSISSVEESLHSMESMLSSENVMHKTSKSKTPSDFVASSDECFERTSKSSDDIGLETFENQRNSVPSVVGSTKSMQSMSSTDEIENWNRKSRIPRKLISSSDDDLGISNQSEDGIGFGSSKNPNCSGQTEVSNEDDLSNLSYISTDSESRNMNQTKTSKETQNKESGNILDKEITCESCKKPKRIGSIMNHVVKDPLCKKFYNPRRIRFLKKEILKIKETEQLKQNSGLDKVLSTHYIHCKGCNQYLRRNVIIRHVTEQMNCKASYSENDLQDLQTQNIWLVSVAKWMKQGYKSHELTSCKVCSKILPFDSIMNHLETNKRCDRHFSEIEKCELKKKSDYIKDLAKWNKRGYSLKELFHCKVCSRLVSLNQITKHFHDNKNCEKEYNDQEKKEIEALRKKFAKCNQKRNHASNSQSDTEDKRMKYSDEDMDKTNISNQIITCKNCKTVFQGNSIFNHLLEIKTCSDEYSGQEIGDLYEKILHFEEQDKLKSSWMEDIDCLKCGDKFARNMILRHITRNKICAKQYTNDQIENMRTKVMQMKELEKLNVKKVEFEDIVFCNGCLKPMSEVSFLKHISQLTKCAEKYTVQEMEFLKQVTKARHVRNVQKHYVANSEKISNNKKEYYKENAESINERSKEHYKENADKLKQNRQDEKQALRYNTQLQVEKFNKERMKLLIYPCFSCHKIMFHRGVIVVSKSFENKLTDHNFEHLVTRNDEFMIDGKYYVCHNCSKLLRKGEMPPTNVTNNLQIVPIPKALQNLTLLERHMIQKHLLFLKIRKLPRSRMLSLNDRVILVPIYDEDIIKTAKCLPRTKGQLGLVSVQLKRQKKLKGYHRQERIRPSKINAALFYLQKHHPDYRDIPIEQIAEDDCWVDLDCPEEDSSECGSDVENSVSKSDNATNQSDDQSSSHEESSDYGDDEIEDLVKNIKSNESVNLDNESDSNEDEFVNVETVSKKKKKKKKKNEIGENSGFLQTTFLASEELNKNICVNTTKKPIRKKMTKNSKNKIVIAPGEGKIPTNWLRDMGVEITAFPEKFSNGENGYRFPRQRPLSLHKYFSQRILNKNPMFSQDADYVFFAEQATQRNAIERQIDISMRKGSIQFEEGGTKLISDSSVFNVFKQIPMTPSYWRTFRNEIFSRQDLF